MLKSLELENFKAFGERVKIDFAPITLIFGENSAGKSSILQSLNLLKQTRESRDTNAILLPRAEGGLVDLGSFNEMIFEHDVSRMLSIKMDLAFQGGRLNRVTSGVSRSDEGQQIGFEIGVNRRQSDKEVCLQHISLFLGESGKAIARYEPATLEDEDRRFLRPHPLFMSRLRRPIRSSELRAARCVDIVDDAILWESSYDDCFKHRDEILRSLQKLRAVETDTRHPSQMSLFVDEQQARASLDRAKEFYSSNFSLSEFTKRMREIQLKNTILLDGFSPYPGRSDRSVDFPEGFALREFSSRSVANVRFVDLNQLVFEAGRAVDEMLEILFPLGPYRRPPERLYIFAGTTPQDVGFSGHLLPNLLFRKPQLVNDTNEWLEKLELGYQIKIRPVGTRSDDLFELRLVDTRRHSPVDVSLSDVGFGISQLLPFVVQSLASSGQIITIEQPEVHIHPRLQADLGDLVAAAIDEPRNHRFIIETHSEHLMLRLLRLVREGKLEPTDLSILFISRGPNGSSVKRLKVDEEGDFVDDWPGGFFPERLRELR